MLPLWQLANNKFLTIFIQHIPLQLVAWCLWIKLPSCSKKLLQNRPITTHSRENEKLEYHGMSSHSTPYCFPAAECTPWAKQFRSWSSDASPTWRPSRTPAHSWCRLWARVGRPLAPPSTPTRCPSRSCPRTRSCFAETDVRSRERTRETSLPNPERVPHQAAVLGADEDAAPRRFQALHELPQVDHAEQRQVVVQVLAHLRLERTYQQVELLGFRGRPRGQRRDGAVGDVQGGGDGAVPRVYEEDVAALGRGQHGVLDGLKRTDSIRKFTTKSFFKPTKCFCRVLNSEQIVASR